MRVTRRVRTVLAAILCAGVVVAFPAGCGSSSGGGTSTSGSTATATTQQATSPAGAETAADLQAFVKKALTYAQSHTKEEALQAFTRAGGEFHQGQLYMFAYGFDGVCLAQGGDPTQVGLNLIDVTDPNGVVIGREYIRLAEQGGGWLFYVWPNPANNNVPEPKLGYVLKVDDGWYLGSGVYGPAAVKPPTEDEVKALVDEAYAYAKANGREAALKAFMDTSGKFYQGQGRLYVFAYDLEDKGKCLSLPAEPGLVGQNRWDLKDDEGVYIIREFDAVVRASGSGLVKYRYLNPAQGNEVQDKIGYVRKVDDTWFLGAGAYQLPE
jgi:signal transduction histidine kinase